MEDPLVLLERNLYDQLLAGLLWERQFESSSGKRLGKVPECSFINRERGLFKLTGNKTLIECGKKVLMKDVDLGKPTSFLDHVYLGCTQRECHISKDIADNCGSVFESRWMCKKQTVVSRRSTESEIISLWTLD